MKWEQLPDEACCMKRARVPGQIGHFEFLVLYPVVGESRREDPIIVGVLGTDPPQWVYITERK